VLGTLLILPGMAFALWGKLALGRIYFVSTNLGAQTFAGQCLITSGPYAVVRHPIYLGVLIATIGSLPLYQTWTTLFLIFCGLVIVRRALAEEKVLAKTFGAEWGEYCRLVPMLLPRLFPAPRNEKGKGSIW
jgi:protein-S-isoprenylcysteine O-methyltransferase Ste14